MPSRKSSNGCFNTGLLSTVSQYRGHRPVFILTGIVCYRLIQLLSVLDLSDDIYYSEVASAREGRKRR